MTTAGRGDRNALLDWRACRAVAGRIAPALLLACLASRGALADNDYQLGHGLDVGPFNFAGYGNLLAEAPDHGSGSLALDDLSLFVSGHIGRLLNPFMEAELTHFDLTTGGRSGSSGGDADVVLERLYNDFYLRDDLTLRLGKMLSPVGAWNEIHAAPLVLTAVRPAVTYRNFSEYATGGSLIYSDPSTNLIDIKLYWQPVGELSERPGNITIHQYKSVEGAEISVPLGLLDKIGVSFQQSKDRNGIDQSLYGLDYHYTLGRWTLQGEGTYSDIGRSPEPPQRDSEWGAYAAVSYALTEQWSVRGWYEGFADRALAGTAQDVLVGLAYQPHSATILRVEYLQNLGGRPVNPTGVFASFAVLF